MEEEVEKFFSRFRSSPYNIIVMTDKILVEWSSNLVCQTYPTFAFGVPFKLKTKTSLLKSVIYQDSRYVEYLSEDFSIYPTFCCVYSVGTSTYDKAKEDILLYYKSTDSHRKMIKYNDYDLKLVYY